MSEEKIVAAAICSGEMIFSIPAPARHHHILHMMDQKFGVDAIKHGVPENQGFLTSEGRFMKRRTATGIAIHAGQIETTKWGYELFSEDLW